MELASRLYAAAGFVWVMIMGSCRVVITRSVIPSGSPTTNEPERKDGFDVKHQHNADLNIRVDLPTQDLEDLIDKATDAALVIIGALTASHILKQVLK